MSYGYRANGVELGDRLTRILGYVDVTPTSGSISVPGFADGEGWFAEQQPSLNPGGPGRSISISGTTLSWSGGNSNATITYGIR